MPFLWTFLDPSDKRNAEGRSSILGWTRPTDGSKRVRGIVGACRLRLENQLSARALFRHDRVRPTESRTS